MDDDRSRHEVPSVEERRAALEERHGPWPSRTLAGALQTAWAEYPDRSFVVGEDHILTYADVHAWSARIARGLLARGVAVGEHVALLLPNGPELIAVRFAIARVGAVAVPINVLLRAQEIAYVLDQSRAVVLVAMEEFRGIDALDGMDRIAPGWERAAGGTSLPALRLVVTVPREGTPSRRPAASTLGDLERDADPDLDAELERRTAAADPGGVASIFYTSGTTGQPKGVLSTHEMELRSAYGSALTRAFEDGRRILFALPLHHVFAYVEGMLAALFVGGSIVPQAAFDPRATLEAVEHHRVDEALFVPTMSLAIVDAARAGSYDLSSLHSVMSAAQSAPAWLWNDLRELLGLDQLVTGYGMTETSAATTFTFPGDPVEDLVQTVGRPKLGGVAGDPDLDGGLAEYRTVDPISGEERARGEEGELVTRGPIVGHGYYGKAQETSAVLLPGGWLRSGDLGRVREDGYLILTGRSKDLYKCGGEMVMPTEIEARLAGRDDVAQAHVVGVPDPRMGEVGCAWIVPVEGYGPSPEDLIAYCRAGLARFKVPAHVLFTTADELPLTASGKVQRFVLAERAAERLGLQAATAC